MFFCCCLFDYNNIDLKIKCFIFKALETVNKQQNDDLERIKEICECIYTFYFFHSKFLNQFFITIIEKQCVLIEND